MKMNTTSIEENKYCVYALCSEFNLVTIEL